MAPNKSLLPPVAFCSDIKSADYDCIVIVSKSMDLLKSDELRGPLKAVADVDKKADEGLFLIPCALPCKRIVYSGTGKLDKDYDDVRRYGEAAEKGIKRALKAGCKAPLLVVTGNDTMPQHGIVAVLGALKALYVPIEVREQVPEKATKVNKLGVLGDKAKLGSQLDLALALEAGRITAKDIGASDPERMAAPRVEEYVCEIFKGTCIKIEVEKGQSFFEKEYPCLAAVNRAASVIPRHDGRVIWLTYEPEGPVEKTLMLVGKGVTYDTGGADIKVGGIMVGMSRDKCGSGEVAGILKAFSILKPKGVKVVGAMAMVRNSVGENCYVADEIITSRAGTRLRVVNTDAEGRMAMGDVLCRMKEKALKEKNPHLMTIATLTGHASMCYGPYTGIMDNGPAAREDFAMKVRKSGEQFGDMFEVSTIRREDYEVVKDKSGEYVDITQCAPKGTRRGHQLASAFLQMVSGLDKHMMSSELPLKYSHLDIAGSASFECHEPTNSVTVAALVTNAMGY